MVPGAYFGLLALGTKARTSAALFALLGQEKPPQGSFGDSASKCPVASRADLSQQPFFNFTHSTKYMMCHFYRAPTTSQTELGPCGPKQVILVTESGSRLAEH